MHGFGLHSRCKIEWYHAKNHTRVCSCNWTVLYEYLEELCSTLSDIILSNPNEVIWLAGDSFQT